jgi:hypothetical protein
MTINVAAGSIDVDLRPVGVRSTYPPGERDYTLDYELDFEDNPIEIIISQEGQQFTVSIHEPFVPLIVSIIGSLLTGHALVAGPITITVVPKFGYIAPSINKSNWVAWSEIGRPVFTISEGNVAGERPMDWSGYVCDIMKLGSSVVVYGDNGVTILSPQGNNWAMKTIHRLGIINKGAVTGNDEMHFFVDKKYRLYKLTSEGLKLLDYSEYLSKIDSVIATFDIESMLVYFCDGSIGYVYSILSDSFGEGPISISGIGSKSGTLYVTASRSIKVPRLELTTDIYDLGSRKPKTISSIELGTNLTEHLEVMIEARLNNRDSFIKSKWSLVNPNGIAYIPCYGVEFKINVRSFIYETAKIDYIKVNGMLHEYNYLEAVQ